MFQDIAYNSDQDHYLVVYQAGDTRGLILTPAGSVGSEIFFGPNLGVADVMAEYNPDRNEFLVVWRYDDPLQVWGRYATGDGSPIGSPFLIGTGGVEPRVVYNSANQRYIVVFSGIGLGANYAVVNGDSTGTPLLLGKTSIDPFAFNARVAYSPNSNKFLITYVRDFNPPTRAEVWGTFLNGNGFGLTSPIGIATGVENQEYPEVGHGTLNDEFMVAYENWAGGGYPDIHYRLVSASGSVGVQRNLTPGSGSWDVTGPIAYDPFSHEFVASYFDGLVSGFTREVKAATGALDHLTLFGGINSNPLGIVVRTVPAQPQAAVVWRNFLGADGVHVSFIDLELPPPTIQNTILPSGGLGVAYSQAIQVVGGTPPLTFSLVSGTVPPGISGPNASTGLMSGTPTAIGNFVFRVRVTDGDGRFDEEDITLAVTLAPPTGVSPTTTTNDTTPTFQWTASPFATSYTLVVENLTDGGTPINQSGIAATSFTPGVPLPSGKIYRWKVQASDGVNLSPFSTPITFEVDAVAPSTVTNLAGGPPTEAVHTGLSIASSSGSLSGYGAERTLDGNQATEYTSPGRTSATAVEQITYDLGTSKPVGRVRLFSREFFGNLMPKDFTIEVSNSPTSGFAVGYTANDFIAPVSPGQWFTFNFAPLTGRYVRLRVTEMNAYTNGQYYVTFTEFEASQTAPVGSVLLTWTAPSDDLTTPGVGSAFSYDVRYTTNAVFNFGTATPVGYYPLPVAAGGQQVLLVTGLAPEVIHRFGLTATDDAGNTSAVSNVAVAGAKGFPPVAVTNLSGLNPGINTVDLRWTAPSDPPSGGAASSYEIRYSATQITAGNFDSATLANFVPGTPPLSPGQQETRTVTGLSPNTSYYFALKSLDGGNNKSDISNVILSSTLDTIPPGPVTTLVVAYTDDETVQLHWNATGDDGPLGTATSFDVRYSISPITEGNFSSATQPTEIEPVPGVFGTPHIFVAGGLLPATAYHFALKVIDDQNNPSTISNVVSATTLANLPEPLMTSPVPGSTLTGTTQMFQWDPNGLAATQWWLSVGSARGLANIHDSGNLGTATSRTVTGLPSDGSTVWARLWYFAGVWGYADFQFTAFTTPPPPPPPEITTPVPGSTLPGPSALFQWTANGAAVTEWWIYAGSSVGGKQYYDSGSLGMATQVTVGGLPTNGSTVHVRLYYRIAGLWGQQDFQYTAATGPGPGNPAITLPVPGSTLTSASELFQWSANGAAVSEWWLWVGRSSASSDILDSGSLGMNTQTVVNGLPVDGSQVFARLWFRIAGVWQFFDAQYTATIGGGGGTPSIDSPSPGSTLTGSSQLFQWSANGAAVAEWWLYAGSTPGGNQYRDSGSLGPGVSQFNVTGLPVNGSAVHIRLFYRLGAVWLSVDAQYTAANLTPAFTSPTPGSTLAGSSQVFQWVTNGAAVTEWWLYAGSTLGGAQYRNSGSLGAGVTQFNVTGLPTNGSTIYLRLYFRIAGLWQQIDATYTAATIRPAIITPAPGTVLPGTSVTFTWTANGVPVQEWWVYAGSAAGTNNFYDSGSIPPATLSTPVVGLPTGGGTVHVTLFYRVSGLWESRAYTYTAAP
jgi:hypothetical protein